MSDSVDIDFYFDPACGWAWRTSLWIREVASLRPVNITWKLVSLGVINAPADWRVGTSANQVRGGKMVRTLIRAQQVGGNDAVNRLFISYGNAMHGRSDDMNQLDVQQRLLTVGMETPPAYAPEQVEDFIRNDVARWTQLVEAVGLEKLREGSTAQ